MAASIAEALKDPAALLALCQVTLLFTIINSIIPCNIITIIVVIIEVPPLLVDGEPLRLLLQGAQRRIFVSCHLHGEVITITIIIIITTIIIKAARHYKDEGKKLENTF